MTSIDAVYRRIGELVTLDYAVIGAGLGKKKPPVCKKGWPCGYSCQPRTKKNCKSGLSGQAKTYADWLGKQAGGAIVVASKSGLQKQGGAPETPKKTAPRTVGPTETIDRKYAKANPTEDDIDGWLKERLDRASSPEGMTISRILAEKFSPPGSIAWNEVPDYVKTADSKASMVRAMARNKSEWYAKVKERNGEFTPEMMGFASEADIKKAEAKLNNPKTKNKEKAQKELDKVRQSHEDGLKIAAKQNEELNKTDAEREADAAKEFDKIEQSMAQASKDLKSAIAKGDVNTIQQETERILRGFEEHQPSDDDTSVLDTRKRQREIVKEYLSNKSKDRIPEDVLGIQGDLTPENIKAAYRKAARSTHPDQGGSREEFEAVNEAYKRLQEQVGFSEPTLGLDGDEDEEDPWQS